MSSEEEMNQEANMMARILLVPTDMFLLCIESGVRNVYTLARFFKVDIDIIYLRAEDLGVDIY